MDYKYGYVYTDEFGRKLTKVISQKEYDKLLTNGKFKSTDFVKFNDNKAAKEWEKNKKDEYADFNKRAIQSENAADAKKETNAGTARDDEIKNQRDINYGNEAKKHAGEINSSATVEDIQAKADKETSEQLQKQDAVNPVYAATRNAATKAEDKEGLDIPDVSEYTNLANKMLGENGGKVEKPDLNTSGKKLDLDAGYDEGQTNEEPSNKDLNEEAKENPEDVVEEVKDDPETRQKLLNDYKAGRLDPYPVLKAVVDIISNNARMNMDRAALLTGGQRDLDAYKPIETETDAIREKQQDARATIGMSLDEAMNRAKNGDYTGLSKAVANGLISVENAAAALNMAPEDLANKWSNETVKDTESTKQSELTTKQQEQNLQQSSLSMINELEKEKAANNEMIRALAGHDTDAFSKAVQAYRGALQGISSVADAYTEQSQSGGEASGGAKFFGTIGADAKGTWGSGSSSTQSGQKDAYLDANIEEILKKGNEAMKASDTANTEFVKKLEARNAQIDKDIANLRKEAKLGMNFKYKAK